MLLTAWLKHGGRSILSFADDNDFWYTTVFDYCHGKPVRDYGMAKRISAATGGEVSVEELQDPQRFGEAKWKKRKVPRRRGRSKKAA